MLHNIPSQDDRMCKKAMVPIPKIQLRDKEKLETREWQKRIGLKRNFTVEDLNTKLRSLCFIVTIIVV